MRQWWKLFFFSPVNKFLPFLPPCLLPCFSLFKNNFFTVVNFFSWTCLRKGSVTFNRRVLTQTVTLPWIWQLGFWKQPLAFCMPSKSGLFLERTLDLEGLALYRTFPSISRHFLSFVAGNIFPPYQWESEIGHISFNILKVLKIVLKALLMVWKDSCSIWPQLF